MSYTVEKIDGNKAVFTITVDSKAFNDAREKAYNKNKNKIRKTSNNSNLNLSK